ncbi:MAG: WD40 repeat domain-containing protein [Candidatus Poribacteria bacterium]|nr:WD40 repeat domain-containing protein [Candidatus Poribacteria bacterium]
MCNIATLTGHAARVWSVVFSPDGRILVSGSGEGTVLLWELR